MFATIEKQIIQILIFTLILPYVSFKYNLTKNSV